MHQSIRDSDQIEWYALRMKELQPRIPEWAKLEKMEISTSQAELWKCADDVFMKDVINRFCWLLRHSYFKLFHRK